MIKIHVNNLEERKNDFIKNYNNIEPRFYKDHYMIKIISSYEIFVYTHFIEPQPAVKVLPKYGIDIYQINNIIKTTEYRKELKVFRFEEQSINVILENDKVKFIFQEFIGDKVEKNFLDYFKEEFLVCVDTENNIKSFELFGEDKNTFLYKEFMSNLSLFNIPYGFVIFFIKENINIVKTYLEINSIEKIENENININNSIREVMSKKQKKRWRSNKKIHVLNIHNIEMIDKGSIYIYNNKFYIKYKDVIYNIKEFYELKRRYTMKIKEKYNRSNEIIYSYKYNEKRYIMKVTRSISKSLHKHLKEINFEEKLDKLLTEDK